MKQQTAMWTACPNGIEGPNLRLSVFVSPRLWTNETARPTLSQFPDFASWPARIAEAQFSVRFGNGAPVPATRVEPENAELRAELWGALLDGETYIKPHEFPVMADRVVRSFSVRNVLTHLKQTYQATAVESPTVVPRVRTGDLKTQPLGRFLGEVAPPQPQKLALARDLNQQLRSAQTRAAFNPTVADTGALRTRAAVTAPGGATVVGAGASKVTTDFLQLDRFYRPVLAAEQAKAIRYPIAVPEIDFHGIVSSLGQYPHVLRLLGLVIDLEVPVSAAPAGATTVAVEVAWNPEMSTTNMTPRTRCAIQAGQFMAQPKAGSDIAGGMLRLDDEERFEVGQVDVDGAAVKTIGLAEDVQTSADDDEKDAALPSLRSAGIWVARTNRAHELAAVVLPRLQVQAQAVLNLERKQSDEVDDLYAEDLVRGYRVDVLDEETGAWRSLCQRVGDYSFQNAGQGVSRTLQLEDEGWVSSAATETLDEDDDDVYIHESMFTWDGWSLSAPRPMGAVPQEGVAESTGQDYGLGVAFAARPGSLPRLRFGHGYRVRARVVDLAGNSLPPTLDDATAASDSLDYVRQEPVTAPVLVPRTSFDASPGETLERMVIRTYNDAPPKDQQPSAEWTDRHVAPPNTSQNMAERHGKFDGAAGMLGDAGTYQLIVDNDGSFADAYDTDQLDVPYLPDPLALGASIRSISIDVDPGPGDSVFKVPFDGDWPDVRPFRIRLVEEGRGDASREPEWHENRRVLTIPIEKAGIAEIWVSCYLPEPEVPKMGLWRWSVEGVTAPAIREARLQPTDLTEVRRQLYQPAERPQVDRRVSLQPAQTQQLEMLHTAVLKGLHWMVTPYRKIILVHAVQQPLVTPDLANLKALKAIGNTYATLDDRFPISGKSTLKVDMVAQWEEPVDSLAEPKWRTIKGTTHVVELPVDYEDTEVRMGAGEPQRVRAATPTMRSLMPVTRGPAPRLRMLQVLGPRHEFGDTKYRRVTYKALATTRFREYFPFTDADIDAGRVSITRESEGVQVDVLSSARPKPPVVRYVIPTFGWEKEDKADGFVSKRAGGGLRVYLERPWFSSGDGELLGVILPSSQATIAGRRPLLVRGQGGVPEALRPFVTQSGADPIWRSGGMKSAPDPQDFRRAVATEDGLSLDELPGAAVAVVGHEVQFDVARQLWFCDIEIDPGDSYYPFVRLALARYQPHSVKTDSEDCKLSRIVMADFAQLAPDRLAAMSYNEGARRAAVSVRGLGYTAPGRGSEMEVTLETRQPGLAGQLGWVPVPDGTVELVSTRLNDRETMWSGEVTLPGTEPPNRFRLIVKEYERFVVDRGPTTGAPPTAMVANIHTERRLVYADVLRLGGPAPGGEDEG